MVGLLNLKAGSMLSNMTVIFPKIYLQDEYLVRGISLGVSVLFLYE